MDLAVIDGANVFNMVGRVVAKAFPDADWVKSYLKHWFDFDRLVYATLGTTDLDMGIVAFHSKKALGPDAYRFEVGEADAFWGRQAIAPGATSVLVDVPRDHQETYEFTCEQCGKEHQVPSKNEKGVDVELVSYLFTTAHAWTQACIFSKDSDFTPAVRALRSRGKKIACAGIRDAKPSALVRNSHHYYDLAVEFLRADAALYNLVRPDGQLDYLVEALEQRGRTVGIVRYSESDRTFFRDGRQFDIGVAYEADNVAQKDETIAIVGAAVRAMGDELSETCKFDHPNTATTHLLLRTTDLLFEGYDRYANELGKARWWDAYGLVHERVAAKGR